MSSIKNNVVPYTTASITVLLAATYDMDVKSISALWHTDYWLLYTVFTASNALLFMFGDNQMVNKIAGLTLLLMLLFPVSSPETLGIENWKLTDYLHHVFAIAFFIIKPLNHRKYDALLIIIAGAYLYSLGIHLYKIEIAGLYILVYTGYLKKKNYFRKHRTYVNSKKKL